MEQEQIIKIDNNTVKVVDYTPTETVYNISDIQSDIDNFNQQISILQSQVQDKQALLDKLTS